MQSTMQRSIQAPMQEDQKKKKKIGINVFTSQKLVNLFIFAVQYYRSWYTSVVYSSPVTQGKHVLHILLHINTV